MKRTIAIVLLLMLIFSLVCCKAKPEGNGTENTQAETTPGPYEPGLTYEEVYNPDTDFDSLRGRTFSLRMMETEDAYIFSTGLYLYYSDKATGDYDVLCPKPECQHDYIRQNKECAGFMNAANCYSFCSYMGQLYFVRYYLHSGQLCRMNFDTSGRENLFTLEFGDGTTESERYSPEYMAIHRGKLYGWSNTNIVEAGEPKFMWSIVCWDLETHEFSVIYEEEDNGGYPCPFFFGDYVYFANTKWEYEEGEDGFHLNYTDEIVKVLRYDTKTGTVEKIFDQSVGPDLGIQQRTFYVAAEDKVYLGGMNDESGRCAVYNFANGELEQVASVEVTGWIMLFPDYFVTCCRNYYKIKEDPDCPIEIGVWDYEGNALFSGEVPLDIVFNVDKKIDHSSVGYCMPIWDGDGFIIPYAAELDVDTEDYESVMTELHIIVRYEVVDGELQEKLLLVNHWPS